MKDPSSQHGDSRAYPERDIAVVADAIGGKDLLAEMDQLFVGKIYGIGEGGYPPGDLLPYIGTECGA